MRGWIKSLNQTKVSAPVVFHLFCKLHLKPWQIYFIYPPGWDGRKQDLQGPQGQPGQREVDGGVWEAGLRSPRVDQVVNSRDCIRNFKSPFKSPFSEEKKIKISTVFCSELYHVTFGFRPCNSLHGGHLKLQIIKRVPYKRINN